MMLRLQCAALVCWLAACSPSPAGPETATPTTPAVAPATGTDLSASSDGDDSPAQGPPRGPRPPDFELDALSGDSVRLSQHLGKDVVLIDFWATYCDPCLAAMPHLNDLYREHQDQGFVILGVSIDGPESIAAVRATVSKLGVEFPILLDDESSVVAKYNPKLSAPFSVLIGRDGSIIKKQEGYTVGKGEQLEADVARAVAAAP